MSPTSPASPSRWIGNGDRTFLDVGTFAAGYGNSLYHLVDIDGDGNLNVLGAGGDVIAGMINLAR